MIKKKIMKKGFIIVAVVFFIAIAFSSCKSSKCPAYSKNTIDTTEQIKA
jgi:hypothetical protein